MTRSFDDLKAKLRQPAADAAAARDEAVARAYARALKSELDAIVRTVAPRRGGKVARLQASTALRTAFAEKPASKPETPGEGR